ncbi:MAG: redox-sensing transcriptional repressor Rex [Clostridiales bacterium]|nr:redox-sensing transcriptional repressor Rex [Clostridiales bacterium]
MEKNISSAVIKRLPRYYRYLGGLLDNGISRISSKDLSEKMNLTASQIRQDLNNFGCFGQQGYGYNVELLYEEIRKILGLDKTYNMIIIGTGNIGQALLNYINYQKRGYNFVGVFDKNPKLIGLNIRGIEIRDVDTLDDFLKSEKVDIAVLTLPGNNAESLIDIIVNNGVRGIWNFSHLPIKPPENVVIENVHLTDSLMQLTYKLTEHERG